MDYLTIKKKKKILIEFFILKRTAFFQIDKIAFLSCRVSYPPPLAKCPAKNAIFLRTPLLILILFIIDKEVISRDIFKNFDLAKSKCLTYITIYTW